MNTITNIFKKIPLAILILIFAGSFLQDAVAQNKDPLRILMITGGGPWHDYNTQKDQIRDGLLERLSNVEITTDYEGADTLTMESTDFFFSRHLKKDWGADFDVVIYNHCNLQVKDENYVKAIVAEHIKYKLPAVMLHCPMHLYQYASGDAPQAWWALTGAVSYVHEKENHPNTPAYTIEVLEPQNPIMKNYPRSWRTPAGELYLIIDLADGVTALSHAYSVETGAYVETAWTHEYQGVRVFSSTLGHHNVSMGSDVNLNLIASGVLWAAGKLEKDGSPAPGYEGNRGLGWISLWDDTLTGWLESGHAMDWTSATWYGRDGNPRMTLADAWNTRAEKSFRLDGDTLVVEGDQRNLFYDGRIEGGYFKNFEFKVDVYTTPGSASGIYFHTRYEEEGTPAYGYEAKINASRDGESKTGSLVGAREVKTAAHKDNEWFSYYIKVEGKKVTVKVNGKTVNEFTEPAKADGWRGLNHGTIGIEAVGSDSRVLFRNPMIRLLPD